MSSSGSGSGTTLGGEKPKKPTSGLCNCGGVWRKEESHEECIACGTMLCETCLEDPHEQYSREVCNNCNCPRWCFNEHAGSKSILDHTNGWCNLHPSCHCEEEGRTEGFYICVVCRGDYIPDALLLKFTIEELQRLSPGFSRRVLEMQFRRTKTYENYLRQLRPSAHEKRLAAKAPRSRSRSRSRTRLPSRRAASSHNKMAIDNSDDNDCLIFD